MSEYTVSLERLFHGPMDLLLHLVREQEVEIHEIEIARVVEGYLRYLEALEELDLEIAGDFLVMAATLMSIKSRSLLPREELDLAEELDPRDELIQRLLEYRRFRDAGERLAEGSRERARLFPRGYGGEAPDPMERELELGELSAWDLLAVYSRLQRETMGEGPHHVAADPHPLRFYVEGALEHLAHSRRTSLRGLIEAFEGVEAREALVGSFCALLELVRLELVNVGQPSAGADIAVQLVAESAEDALEVVRRSLADEPELTPTGPPPAAEKA